MENEDEMIDLSKKSKNLIFSTLNLAKLIDTVGGIGKINGYFF